MHKISNISKDEFIKRGEKVFKTLIDDWELLTTVPKEHLDDTPKRVAKAHYEFFSSCYQPAPEMTTFPTQAPGVEVLVENIQCVSTCAHHFVPFIGYGTICYLPNKLTCGISKLGRILEYYARKPQIQENLTYEIGKHISKELDPHYLYVVLGCKHLCMSIRGIEDHSANTVTSYVYKSKDFSGMNFDSKIETAMKNLKRIEF